MGMLHGQFEVMVDPDITATPPIVAGVDKPAASLPRA